MRTGPVRAAIFGSSSFSWLRMYQPVVGSAAPLGPVRQRTVVCLSSGSASWPIVAGRSQCRSFRFNVVMASPTAPPGSSRCSCMWRLSGLEGSGCCSCGSVRGQRFVVHGRVLGFEFVSGSRPTSSAVPSLFGSSLIRSAAAYRRSSFLSVRGPLSLSSAMASTCSAISVRTVSSTRSAHCWCAGLASPVSICRLLACMLSIAIGHTVFSTCSYVSSRRVARIRPLRPMRQGTLAARSGCVRWRRRSVRGGPLGRSSLGGFRPARVGLSVVLLVPSACSDRARSRSFGCSAPCGHAARFRRFPSFAEWTNVLLDVRSCNGASCASRAAFVVLVPVVEVWTLDAVRAVRGPGWVVDEGRRPHPPGRRDPGHRLLSLDAWVLLFSRRGRCVSAARPHGRPVYVLPRLTALRA